MSRWTRRCTLAGVALLVLAASLARAGERNAQAPATSGRSGDRIAFPPPSRKFPSRSGRLVLSISAVDGWKSPRASATLAVDESGVAHVLWSQALPQQYGPKSVLVADSGVVVLFDEWIHVRTPLAIVVLDRQGHAVARHSTEDVRARLDVPPDRMARAASSGLWMAGEPAWAGDDRSVQVCAAGKSLRISLVDGSLSVDQGRRPGE